ncbi:IclR family transcriptional regulator [Halegenticoccus tardaugens]|uniref:IclR family transcriptional regulator n=1 Tax=Halegenticoccus tardaugens TaxID=2071624 RepID=UPI00100BF54D|nr:IclR family transcriptional regulator [Halegenticoccus tardaugens]
MVSTDKRSSSRRIKSLERGLEIVDCLREAGELTVSDLAAQKDMPTSTAHIYLKTLSDLGYVLQDGSSYRLGLKFLQHGGQVRQQTKLYQIARVEIDTLAEVTGEVSALGVSENGKRVLLYKSEGSEAVYDNPPIGEYTHMHWTALGKAILAHLPRDEIDRIIDRHGLPLGTQQTIDDREELHEELSVTVERGYAIEDEERWTGIRSVAVPLLDGTDVVGSISVSGPKRRFEREWIETELLEHLTRSKNVIDVRLAHQ